ncbi:hypothetical protein H4R35_002110, partial [Dimargaris xerosporica]
LVAGVPPNAPLSLPSKLSSFDGLSPNTDKSTTPAPGQTWSKVGRGALSYIRSFTDLRQQSNKDAGRATGDVHQSNPQYAPRAPIQAFRGLEQMHRALLHSQDIQEALAQFHALGKLLTFSEQTHEMKKKQRVLETARNSGLIVLTIDLEPLASSVDGATNAADQAPHSQPAARLGTSPGSFPKRGRQRANTISHPSDWRTQLGIIHEAAEKPWAAPPAIEIPPQSPRPPFWASADDPSVYGDDSSSISSDSSQFSIQDYAQFLSRPSYSDLEHSSDEEDTLGPNLLPLDQRPSPAIDGVGQGVHNSNRFGHTRSASSPQLPLYPLPSSHFNRPKPAQTIPTTAPKHPSVLRYSQLADQSDSDSDDSNGEDGNVSSLVKEQYRGSAIHSAATNLAGTTKLTRLRDQSDSSVCVAAGVNGLYTIRALVDSPSDNLGDANQQYLWLHNSRRGIYLLLDPNQPDDETILCKFRQTFGLSLGHTAITCPELGAKLIDD